MFLLCLLLAFLWKPWQHCDQGQHDTNAVLLHVSYLFSCKNHDNIVTKVSMTLSQFYLSSFAFLQKPWQHCDRGQRDLQPVLFLVSYLLSCKNHDNIATEVSMTLSPFYFSSRTCFPAKTMTTLRLRSAWPWARFTSCLILVFLQKNVTLCPWSAWS